MVSDCADCRGCSIFCSGCLAEFVLQDTDGAIAPVGVSRLQLVDSNIVIDCYVPWAGLFAAGSSFAGDVVRVSIICCQSFRIRPLAGWDVPSPLLIGVLAFFKV